MLYASLFMMLYLPDIIPIRLYYSNFTILFLTRIVVVVQLILLSYGHSRAMFSLSGLIMVHVINPALFCLSHFLIIFLICDALCNLLQKSRRETWS